MIECPYCGTELGGPDERADHVEHEHELLTAVTTGELDAEDLALLAQAVDVNDAASAESGVADV